MLERKHRHALSLTLAAATAALAPSAARADPSATEATAASSLFDEASTEMDDHQYASACPKLEKVTRLVPRGIGARLTLGECYEGWGKLASAWSQYTLVESLAAKAGDTERSQQAAAKAGAIRPRLTMLLLEVPAEVRRIPGVSITRNGLILGESQWGTAVPVDRGPQRILVQAPGYHSWQTHVLADAEGQRQSVTAGAPEPESAPPVEPDAGASVESPRPWQKPTGIAALSLGAAGVAVGAVLGGLTFARTADSKRGGHCDARSACDPAGAALRNEARAFGDGSTAAFLAGGALLAGGLALVLTAPGKPKDEPRTARIDLSLNGIQIGGTW